MRSPPRLVFIDLHLLHEVTSPQAFDGLRKSGRGVRRLDLTIATEDHNTPTLDIDKPLDENSRWRPLNGLDDISITLRNEADIAAYEAKRPAFKPQTLPL